MSRAPFQVLVLPYRRTSAGTLEYAIFQPADSGAWQGIAGGGDTGENPAAAAAREAHEEAGIPRSAASTRLTSVGEVGVEHFRDRHGWDPALRTIPEHSFGVAVGSAPLVLSSEHRDLAWTSIDDALEGLAWDSNRVALQELDERLRAAGWTVATLARSAPAPPGSPRSLPAV